MKLKAFQIKNYRSIIETGWCYLSFDNITALIGQNESGKTSVLESLKSFHDGHITDDVLRSDQKYPEISCLFEVEEGKSILDLLNAEGVPPAVREILERKTEVRIRRLWTNAETNRIEIAEDEISACYESLAQQNEQHDRMIRENYSNLVSRSESLAEDLRASGKEAEATRSSLDVISRKLNEARHKAEKESKSGQHGFPEQETEALILQQQALEAEHAEKIKRLDDLKAVIQKVTEKLQACQTYMDLSRNIIKIRDELSLKCRNLQEIEKQIGLSCVEKEKRNLLLRLEQLKTIIFSCSKDLGEMEEQLLITGKTVSRMLEGKNYREASEEAAAEWNVEKKYMTLPELCQELFRHVPLFEFFEDFSSLLPNKIDLEDLLNENTHCEGYKAARNFLIVAGLNADFFREQNHRILKQKIENLNGEITVDFQDYWHQYLGQNNKIKINFELEHYDCTVPEKSGKPYLEFWIKDKQERLYPKQRSRGVRWFLSFYLELKATARLNHVRRVMLIDEPGVSLHARAQEDVLKVFEDLKDSLQIVYSTHSPNLIDPSRLYRILAVQRLNTDDETSETIVMDPRSLHEASPDTLAPIYVMMGSRINDQTHVHENGNIIVEDTITFYYLSAMAGLHGLNGDAHFIPSTGTRNIPLMVNMLLGWKLDFGILAMDNEEGNSVIKLVRKTAFLQHDDEAERKARTMQGFHSVEDLFSTIDFKRHILQQRIGITERNSEYIDQHQLSRIILATSFCNHVQKDGIALTDFDEETRHNFSKLFLTVRSMISKEQHPDMVVHDG